MFDAIMHAVEEATGVDIDGDGIIGPKGGQMKPHPTGQGRTRSLFIGINYIGSSAELGGCINDVVTMQNLLQRLGFDLEDKRVLTENEDIPGFVGAPTKSNILACLQWLVDGASPGDTLFLHYSGHGTSVEDRSGDEEDGKDEALVPLDYQQAGVIVDDDIYKIVAGSLPDGVRLTAVLDCCHSGTLMDLPYSFEANRANIRTKNMMQQRSARRRYGNRPKWARILAGEALEQEEQASRAVGPDIIMFSGCKDEQTSADVSNTSSFDVGEVGPGGAGGACTNALAEILIDYPNLTFVHLLENMRRNLEKRRFTQIPQLSSSKPLNMNAPFSMWGPFE